MNRTTFKKKNKILKFIDNFLFAKKNKREDDILLWKMNVEDEVLGLWKPTLIEWIAKTNDPILLSVTACLINEREWPDWLPSNPDKYKECYFSAIVEYECSVIDALESKSEMLCPNLYHYIHMTRYYEKYRTNKQNNF